MSKRLLLVSPLILAFLATSPAYAQPSTHPPTLTLDGATALPLAGQALRTHLLGEVDLYSVAVYVDGRISDFAHLSSPDVSKALRLEIRYRDDLKRRLLLDWWRELVPRIDAGAAAHLQTTFTPLRDGDVVLIKYTARRGTTVQVNRAVAVSGANHDLMLAFLEHWVGQRPVSEEIKRTLMGSV